MNGYIVCLFIIFIYQQIYIIKKVLTMIVRTDDIVAKITPIRNVSFISQARGPRTTTPPYLLLRYNRSSPPSTIPDYGSSIVFAGKSDKTSLLREHKHRKLKITVIILIVFVILIIGVSLALFLLNNEKRSNIACEKDTDCPSASPNCVNNICR